MSATTIKVDSTFFARSVTIEVPKSLSDHLLSTPHPTICYGRYGATCGGKTVLDGLLTRLVDTSRGRLHSAEDETLGFHGDEQICITLWGKRPVSDKDVERLVRRLERVKVKPPEEDKP